VDLALQIPLDRGCRGRAPRAVIGSDLSVALGLNQRKAVTADAGRLRLDDPKQPATRDRSVRRSAARRQNLDRGHPRTRMRRRDHRVHGMDRGAAGEMEIPHRWITFPVLSGSPSKAGLHDIFMPGSAMVWHTNTASRTAGFSASREPVTSNPMSLGVAAF